MSYLFTIRELDVGVGDREYKVLVNNTSTLNHALKKLKRHLDNFYEDKLFIVEVPAIADYMVSTFQRHGGCLIISWKDNEPANVV